MDSGRPQRSRPLLPVALAGLLLLLLGVVFLVAGTWLFPGNLVGVEAWVAGVGVLLLVGTAIALRLFGSGRTGPPTRELPAAGVETRGPAVVSEEGGAAWADGEAPRAPVPPAPAPTATRPVSTSIPGAYLAAVDALAREEHPAWSEAPPPIAAALPFAAMPRPPEGRGPSAEGSETSAVLEVELARLRARLRELEAEGPPAATNGPRLAVSGGSRGPLTVRPTPDFPRPGPPAAGAPRFCAGCGTTVPPSPASPLCASCGRLLCATCAERSASATGRRYCPACTPRRREPSSMAISGGRTGGPASPGAGLAPNGTPPTGPR